MIDFETFERHRRERAVRSIDREASRLHKRRNLGIFIIGVWKYSGELHCLPFVSIDPTWDAYERRPDTSHHFGLIANMEDDYGRYFGGELEYSKPCQEGYKGSLRGFVSLAPRLSAPLKKHCKLMFFHAPDDVTHAIINDPSERGEAVAVLRDATEAMASSLSTSRLRISPSYRESWR